MNNSNEIMVAALVITTMMLMALCTLDFYGLIVLGIPEYAAIGGMMCITLFTTLATVVEKRRC